MTASSRAHLVLAIMLGCFAVIAFVVALVVGVPWWLALIAVVVVAVVVAAVTIRRAPAAVLRRLHVHPADIDGRHERLGHLVSSLCLAHGLREPKLAVIDDSASNALVVGRSAEEATLVVTRGLIDSLDRTELEGVVAHLLARLRSPGLAGDTLAAVVVGRWLAPIPVLQRRALAWIIDDHPAVRADRDAVSMTRYPPGLVAALATISATDDSVRFSGRATRHLWLDDPVRATDDAIDIPLAERIDVLQEL